MELRQLGIRQLCATDCTGDRAIALFRESFGEGYLEGDPAGRSILNDP